MTAWNPACHPAGPIGGLEGVARTRWHELDTRTPRLSIVGAMLEGLLKIAAPVDLARRPAREVRGSKLRWAVSTGLVNSLGIVPVTYLVRGRRRSSQT